MLTIKRVPTLVSNYQEDVPESNNVVGCGRNCLGKCCLPGLSSILKFLHLNKLL